MSASTLAGNAGILVVRRFAAYKDEPWRLYHYPNGPYASRIKALRGRLVLLYEPRRGGDAPDSPTGGRSAFVGWAFLGDSRPDPDDATHSYVELRHACEFAEPVSLATAGVSQVVVRSAVAQIAAAIAEKVLQAGVAAVLQPAGQVSEGLVDLSGSPDLANRPIREVLTSRPVRDRAFRARVVRDAYDGRCAFSGIRMTNGHGRAEADAAHIRPVENDGPDTVQNGIALTKTLHWAFDRGLLSLGDDGRILTIERGLDDAVRRLLIPSATAFLPASAGERPHPAFLRWHRANVFKGAA
jgi:putative restriction endonuclease